MSRSQGSLRLKIKPLANRSPILPGHSRAARPETAAFRDIVAGEGHSERRGACSPHLCHVACRSADPCATTGDRGMSHGERLARARLGLFRCGAACLRVGRHYVRAIARMDDWSLSGLFKRIVSLFQTTPEV